MAREQRRIADLRWIALLRQEGDSAFVNAWERQSLFATQSGVPGYRLMRQRARRLGQCATGLQASLRAQGLGEMPDMRAVIRGYAGQMDWIAGLDDRKFSAVAVDVAKLRPSMNCRLMPGVGHNPLLEAPALLSDSLRALFATSVA
jgi:2-succinyl-6-hydroxy-2,4-cyclohexadiene-1-carboxylate synthase